MNVCVCGGGCIRGGGGGSVCAGEGVVCFLSHVYFSIHPLI